MKLRAYIAALHAVLFAILLAVSPAGSGSMTLLGAGAPAAGGGSPVTVSGATTIINGSCGFLATCTTAAVTVPSGFVVFGIGGINNGGAGQTISSVVVNAPCSGSISAAANPTAASSSQFAALFAGTIVGGSCTVTVTSSGAGALATMGVALEALANVLSTTAGTACSNAYNNSGANPYVCSSSITIASSGIAIAVLASSTAGSLSSTNLTIDAQSAGGSGLGIAIAHSSVAGPITPAFTTTSTFDISSLSAVPWR